LKISPRLHPYLAQNELREYCRKKGITITAYTPSGKPPGFFFVGSSYADDFELFTGYSAVRNDPLIVSLAEKYKVTPTQVILAWHLSRGTIIVPKSENSERQKENLAVSECDYFSLL
jgi:glycerol 2-dehydrogenase (NADP+)